MNHCIMINNQYTNNKLWWYSFQIIERDFCFIREKISFCGFLNFFVFFRNPYFNNTKNKMCFWISQKFRGKSFDFFFHIFMNFLIVFIFLVYYLIRQIFVLYFEWNFWWKRMKLFDEWIVFNPFEIYHICLKLIQYFNIK